MNLKFSVHILTARMNIYSVGEELTYFTVKVRAGKYRILYAKRLMVYIPDCDCVVDGSPHAPHMEAAQWAHFLRR
jgi:hypothetical protein